MYQRHWPSRFVRLAGIRLQKIGGAHFALIPFFKCSKCKKTFDWFEDVEAYKYSHLNPVEVSVKSYSIKPYLYSVEVMFNNGEAQFYNAENLGG